MNDVACMRLVMKEGGRRSWYYPLQKGVFLPTASGMSVREFLHDVLHFDDAYIESTVRTIFLNNSPVDDIDRTRIADGDRLALGSAMPGLVGIVMGRDNPFKSFRSDISARDGATGSSGESIFVGVKLFSSLAAESGAAVLERGVTMDALMLADFLADRTDQVIDADGMDGEALVAALRDGGGRIAIRVEFK